MVVIELPIREIALPGEEQAEIPLAQGFEHARAWNGYAVVLPCVPHGAAGSAATLRLFSAGSAPGMRAATS